MGLFPAAQRKLSSLTFSLTFHSGRNHLEFLPNHQYCGNLNIPPQWETVTKLFIDFTKQLLNIYYVPVTPLGEAREEKTPSLTSWSSQSNGQYSEISHAETACDVNCNRDFYKVLWESSSKCACLVSGREDKGRCAINDA